MTRPTSPRPQTVRLPLPPRPLPVEALRGPTLPVIRGATVEFGD